MKTYKEALVLRKRRKKHSCHLSAALLMGFLTSGCAGLNLLQEQVPYTVTNHTLKELRDMNVVKQALDYSCGAAALATLLIYYYGDVTSEADILESLQSGLTKNELLVKEQRGFSLLDLKRTALAKGYRAAGFRLKPGQLMQLAAPVMVFVEPLGYKHFAVLRGVRNGEVYLADPARGNLRMRLDQFVQEWEQGIVFVLGKAGEEQIRDYPLLPAEPFADVRPAYIGFIDFQDQAAQTRTLVFR